MGWVGEIEGTGATMRRSLLVGMAAALASASGTLEGLQGSMFALNDELAMRFNGPCVPIIVYRDIDTSPLNGGGLKCFGEKASKCADSSDILFPAFAPALPSSTVSRNVQTSTCSLKMGLFDGLFGGNKSPPPPSQPAVPSERLQPIKGKTIVTFMPSNQQVYGRPGERLGDVAQRAGINVPYGCREGVCGTCEAKMRQPTGQINDVRICRDIVPKTNLDSPDREKMWGDLRGGKKSVSELRGTPEEITVTLQNPNLALKRQQSWEQIKDQAKAKTKDWLDPNYQAPSKRTGGIPPPPSGPKKWF